MEKIELGLQRDLDAILERFKTEMMPEFENALGKIPADQQSMIVSLLTVANTQRFATAVLMADMDVFRYPIKDLGDALGKDVAETKKYLQTYSRLYRLLDH